MSVLAVLFQSLAAAQRAGVGFDEAWQAATVEALGSSCNPADWDIALESTRRSWHGAYEGMPASPAERSLSLLSEDMELVNLSKGSKTRRVAA